MPKTTNTTIDYPKPKNKSSDEILESGKSQKKEGNTGERRVWVSFIFSSTLLVFASAMYNVLRILKDALITLYAHPVALSFIRGYLVTPFMFVLPFALQRLGVMVPNTRHRFYYILGIFFAFDLFVYFLFPYSDMIQPRGMFMEKFRLLGLGQFGDGAAAMLDCWFFCLIYLKVECWGVIGIPILAWNSIHDLMPKLSKERRGQIYSLFSVVTNVFSFFTSLWVTKLSLCRGNSGLFLAKCREYLFWCTIFSPMIMLASYIILSRIAGKKTEPVETTKKEGAKLTGSLYGLVFSDPYYRSILLMVVGYNVCIMAVDSFAKPAVIEAIGGGGRFSAYQGYTYAINSAVSIIIGLLNAFVFKSMSVAARAVLPMLLMGITGSVFFLYYIFNSTEIATETLLIGDIFSGFLGTFPQHMIPLLACSQTICAKSAKYAGFDGCKECFMLVIGELYRFLVKGVVDVAGSRISKAIYLFIFTFALFGVALIDMDFAARVKVMTGLLPFGFICLMLIGIFTKFGRSTCRRYWYISLPFGISGAAYFGFYAARAILQVFMQMNNELRLHCILSLSFLAFLVVVFSCSRKNKILRRMALYPLGVIFISFQAYKIYSTLSQPALLNQEDTLHYAPAPVTRSKKAKNKDLQRIAPLMFLIFLLLLIVWSLSLRNAYRLYQERVGEKHTGISYRDIGIMLLWSILIFAFVEYVTLDVLTLVGITETSIPDYLRASFYIRKIPGVAYLTRSLDTTIIDNRC